VGVHVNRVRDGRVVATERQHLLSGLLALLRIAGGTNLEPRGGQGIISKRSSFNPKAVVKVNLDIPGVWSTRVFGDYDGLWDEFLTFREDGTGRNDVCSQCGHDGFEYESTVFRWNSSAPGYLTVLGAHCFRFSFAKPLHDLRESRRCFRDVPYEINTETNLRGVTVPVLRARLWLPQDVGFGLVTKEIWTFSLEQLLGHRRVPR
jgi:hypothetical protein